MAVEKRLRRRHSAASQQTAIALRKRATEMTSPQHHFDYQKYIKHVIIGDMKTSPYRAQHTA